MVERQHREVQEQLSRAIEVMAAWYSSDDVEDFRSAVNANAEDDALMDLTVGLARLLRLTYDYREALVLADDPLHWLRAMAIEHTDPNYQIPEAGPTRDR